MADILNNFYVNIGKTVEEKIPKGNKGFSHYLIDQTEIHLILYSIHVQLKKSINIYI